MQTKILNRGWASDWRLNRGRRLFALPAGIIFPAATSSPPAGWEYKYHTDYAGRMIRCEGTGTSVGVDVIIDASKYTINIGAAGGHLGPGVPAGQNSGGMGITTKPDHDHGGSVECNHPFPDRMFAYLWKATAGTEYLPEGAAFLAYDTDNRIGFQRITPPDSKVYCLQGPRLGNSAAGFGFYGKQDFTTPLPADPNHDHGGISGGDSVGSSTEARNGFPGGGHAHGGEIGMANATIEMERSIFNLWKALETMYVRATPGIVGLWDQPNIPEGWQKFDHTYDYIQVANNIGDAGVRVQNGNTFSYAPQNTGEDGSHRHSNSKFSDSGRTENQKHESFEGLHSHLLSMNPTAFRPYRVSLHVIQRLF